MLLHLKPPFGLQALSNTLWGLSKLEIKDEGLMTSIGEEARRRLHDFNSQNLANSVRLSRRQDFVQTTMEDISLRVLECPIA